MMSREAMNLYFTQEEMNSTVCIEHTLESYSNEVASVRLNAEINEYDVDEGVSLGEFIVACHDIDVFETFDTFEAAYDRFEEVCEEADEYLQECIENDEDREQMRRESYHW